jgi:hypothetical protein
MAQNRLFFFTNISAENLMHILDNGFCTERNLLAHFCTILFLLKASKIFAQKLLFFAAKNVGEIDLRAMSLSICDPKVRVWLS